jgi:G:T-mismatch repair DNA endonuclease (very short patch repair protein)
MNIPVDLNVRSEVQMNNKTVEILKDEPEKIIIFKEYFKKNRRFNLEARTVEFKIKPIPLHVEPVSWIKDAIKEIVLRTTKHLKSTDQVGFTFCSKNFEKGTGWIRFQQVSKISVDDVWTVLSGIFQSNSSGMNTDKFCLGVTSVKMPSGKGRGKMYNTFNEECAMRKGIVSITNTDNLCLPRALVVAIAHITRDPNYAKIRRDIGKEQTFRAESLIKNLGVKIPEEGAGIFELKQLQNYLTEYNITVYKYGTKGREVVFDGSIDSPLKINLLYNDGHYNVITSLTAAFCCTYFCEKCKVPYNTKKQHRCSRSCQACLQSPPCLNENNIKCAECHRTFRSKACFENHKIRNSFNNSTVCNQIKLCLLCFKTIKSDRQHYCGEVFCKICQKHQPQDHRCYIQVDTGKPNTEDFLFVFYDLEARQETKLEDGSFLHEPTLCVFKQCCDQCIYEDKLICKKCGVRTQIVKNTPIASFLHHLLCIRKKFKNVVVVAHNGQAYDHQFVLNYILMQTDIKPEIIMRGTKIILMQLQNLKFIDSLNFFPMSLAKLPKAFGLSNTFKKGYFPHLFNTKSNENYVGLMPDSSFFGVDEMKECGSCDDLKCKTPGCRNNFLQWHEAYKNNIFDFQKELTEYCLSDVEILTQSFLKFREQLLTTSNVCPLRESCTIASACNKIYRRNFLQPNTIGIIPKNGYRLSENQSKIAIKWLIWEENLRQINILHSAKQREVMICGLRVDGYCNETNQVFEFNGCYYHGCPTCFKYNRNAPLHDNSIQTLNTRLESTVAKSDRIRECGYEVIEIWECEFRCLMKNNPNIEFFIKNHPFLVNSPLNPRDAFYGGRTGNTRTYYEATKNEKIKYVDICSLYPWVCKYGKFPIGHPEVILGKSCEELNIFNIDGLIKCKILPPTDLYHPVLPLKMNNKLMFVLCRTCGENMKNENCKHSTDERILHGTWVIDEVLKAIEKGYKIQEIQEIWKYKVVQYDPELKVGGLFTEMMNKFIKIKQEASGWPSDCITPEQRNTYIDNYFRKEGIKLEPTNIINNAGLRSLGKLLLNCFWGRLGMRENQSRTKIINQPDELLEMLLNPSLEVNGILPISENCIVLNYEFVEEAFQPISTVNVCLAAYTTAQARLKLYHYLEKIGNRVLYYDTDSIIYISREGEYDVPIGNMLGDMTNELAVYGSDSFIKKFASGGPKNYSYEVISDKGVKTVVKVKGIGLTHKTSQLINFEKIANMILEESEPVPIISSNIRRTINHQVVSKIETKLYKPNSTKRRFNGNDSVPYGYKTRKLNESV